MKIKSTFCTALLLLLTYCITIKSTYAQQVLPESFLREYQKRANDPNVSVEEKMRMAKEMQQLMQQQNKDLNAEALAKTNAIKASGCVAGTFKDTVKVNFKYSCDTKYTMSTGSGGTISKNYHAKASGSGYAAACIGRMQCHLVYVDTAAKAPFQIQASGTSHATADCPDLPLSADHTGIAIPSTLRFSFHYTPENQASDFSLGINEQVSYSGSNPLGGSCGESLGDIGSNTLSGEGVEENFACAPYRGGFKLISEKTLKRTVVNGGIEEQYSGTERYVVYIGCDPEEQKYVAQLLPMQKDSFKKFIPRGPELDGSTTKGNSIAFHILVHEKGDENKVYPLPYKVAYHLRSVTHYTGYCMNFPLKKDHPNTNADLVFEPSLVSNSNFYSKVSEADLETVKGRGAVAPAVLTAMDYGAYGVLTAVVTLDDGTELDAVNFMNFNKDSLQIPLDDNHNLIADAWEQKEGILNYNYPMTWDNDPNPNNGKVGDNIFMFDEYRGLAYADPANNDEFRFIRLSPLKKELFVMAVTKNYLEQAKRGTELFEQASQLKIYYFKRQGVTEMDMLKNTYPRCMNFNTPFLRHFYCVAAKITEDTAPGIEENTMGSNILREGIPEGNGSYFPSEVDYVYASIKNIRADIEWHINWLRPYCADTCFPLDQRTLRQAIADYQANIDTNKAGIMIRENVEKGIKEMIAFTICHELGHATHMHHHNLNYPPVEKDEKRGWFTGDADCPMRYWLRTGSFEMRNNSEWAMLYWTGYWKPSTGITPLGNTFRFCTTKDDCFHQMSLR